MPNNNPSGVNGFEGFGADQPYGAELKQHQLAQAAPIPGVPLTNAPQRAQRQAARGRRPQQQAQPQPPPQATAQTLAQPMWVAQAWAAIAAEPGASDLVKQQAQLAAKAAGIA